MSRVFGNLPNLNELLESPALKQLVGRVSVNAVVAQAKQFLDGLRNDVQSAVQSAGVTIPTPAELAQRIADWISSQQSQAFRPVINATGTLLPPGGRLPLAPDSLEALRQSAAGYANLPTDAAAGNAAKIVEDLLTKLTGAEAALVLNSESAALWLTFAAVAPGKEVIVSRGALIAIDGQPFTELAPSAGTVLREVGTTNRTTLDDVERALSEATAAILRVRPMEYSVVGQSEQPATAELVPLARKQNAVLVDLLGGGALVDVNRFGIQGEPQVRDALAAGADLVIFRGDDLLGGPSCGLIVGKKSLIEKLRRHPLAVGLGADTLTLSAMAATLQIYTTPDTVEARLPLLTLLSISPKNLKNRAERLAPQLAAITSRIAAAEVVTSFGLLRGVKVPGQELPGFGVALTPARGSAEELAETFRRGEPGIVGRVVDGQLIFDLRSVFPRQDLEIAAAASALQPTAPPPVDPPVAT